jgi:hypothetical protein
MNWYLNIEGNHRSDTYFQLILHACMNMSQAFILVIKRWKFLSNITMETQRRCKTLIYYDYQQPSTLTCVQYEIQGPNSFFLFLFRVLFPLRSGYKVIKPYKMAMVTEKTTTVTPSTPLVDSGCPVEVV